MSKFFSLRSDVLFLAIVLTLVALALCLRLNGIDRHEVWHDEAISFHMATHSDWLRSARLGPHPPLYYLVLRAWVPLAGSSPASLRLPSALFGTLSILVLIGLGSQVLNREAGLWAGGFAAIAPIHVYYSQEARSYALLILVLLLTTWTLWRAMQQNTWKQWGWVFICTLTAFYVHLFSVLALFPTLLLLALWPERPKTRPRWPGFVLVVLGCGLLLAPWALWTAPWQPTAQQENIGFVETLWRRTPPLLAIPKSIETLALGFHSGLLPVFLKGAHWLEWPPGFRVLGLGLVSVLAILAIVPWGDRRLGIPCLGRRKAWIVSLVFFPLLVLWLLSFYRPVFIVGRYDIIVFPGFALLAGLSFTKLRQVPKRGSLFCWAAALIFAWVIGNKLARYYQVQPTRDASATARMLHRAVANDDVVVFTGGYGAGIDVLYYLYRLGYRNPYCSNRAENRHFVCRMFPSDYHETRFLDPDLASIEGRLVKRFENEAHDYERALKDAGGGIWLVLWGTGFGKGKGRLSPSGQTKATLDEALLIHTLESMGFSETFARSAPWILRFKKPPNPTP